MEVNIQEIEEILRKSFIYERELLVRDIYAAAYLPREEIREILGIDEDYYQERLRELLSDELTEKFECLPKAFKSKKIIEFKKDIGG